VGAAVLLLAVAVQPSASAAFIGDPLTVAVSRGTVYPGDVQVIVLSARNADGSGRTASAGNLRVDLYDPDNLLAATVTPTEITSPAATGAYRFAFTFNVGAKLGSYIVVARTTDVLPTSATTAFTVQATPPATLAQIQAALDAARAELDGRLDTMHTDVNAHLDSARSELDGRLDATHTDVNAHLDSARSELDGRLDAAHADVNAHLDTAQAALHGDVASSQTAVESHIDSALDDAVSWAMDQANVTFHVENITIDHERLERIEHNLTALDNTTEAHVRSLEQHRALSPEYTAAEQQQSWLDTIGQLAWVIWGLYFVATRFVNAPILRVLLDLVGFGLLALPIPEAQATILFFAPLAAVGWDAFRYTEEYL
jgi:hypothetical protein